MSTSGSRSGSSCRSASRTSREVFRGAALAAALLAAGSPMAAADPGQPEGLRPGDCNADERVDIADAARLLEILFQGVPLPSCRARCDINGQRLPLRVDLSDAIYLLGYLFQGGPLPRPILLEEEVCGDRIDNDCNGEVDEECQQPTYAVTVYWDPVDLDVEGNPDNIVGYRLYLLGLTDLDRRLMVEVNCILESCTVPMARLEGLEFGIVHFLVATAVDYSGNESPPSGFLGNLLRPPLQLFRP